MVGDGASLAPQPAARPRPATPPALWAGLFGAPLAWSIQHLTIYALAAHSCFPHTRPVGQPLVGALSGVLAGISVAAAAIALAALATTLRSWREFQGQRDLLETGEGRLRFMIFAGLLLGILFLTAILFNGLGVLLVSPCG